MYTVTVTSQGQITIPAKLRRELDLDRATLSVTKNDKGNIEFEKIPDFLSLGGSLNKYAKNINKGLSSEEIRKREKKAVEEGRIEDYKKSLKRMSNTLIIV
ncbi:MAG: hypothetical protein O3B87_05135 [bacterium]|nr:hypothetical protein [bacterium]